MDNQLDSNYKKKYWYSAQDETFEYGCLFIFPYTCFFLVLITEYPSWLYATIFAIPILLLAVAAIYAKSRQKADTMQKVFQKRGRMMSRVVENVLIDKQLPYETATSGRETTYHLTYEKIEINVGPNIYTVYKRNYGYQQIEDGVVVKIRGPDIAKNLLYKSIKRQIDERAELLNLTYEEKE